MTPRITQKRSKLYGFSLETLGKHLFSEMHRSKKAQRKNLAQAIYYIRIHQRVRSKMCHLGMPAKQPHILSHVDYICWTRPFHKSIFYEIAKDWLYLFKDTSSVMGERQRSEMNLKAPTKIWSM